MLGTWMPITVKGFRKNNDGEDRFYEWNGEQYPSVTTVLKYCIPKPALTRWQAKLVADTAIDELQELSQLSKSAAKKYLLSLAEDAKDSKAGIGTEVHAFAEATANGSEPPEASEKALPYLSSFSAFQYDVAPEYLGVELPVFNRTHGYAGTADIFAKVDGRTVVIDIKTGRSIWPEVALQLAAYARGEF